MKLPYFGKGVAELYLEEQRKLNQELRNNIDNMCDKTISGLSFSPEYLDLSKFEPKEFTSKLEGKWITIKYDYKPDEELNMTDKNLEIKYKRIDNPIEYIVLNQFDAGYSNISLTLSQYDSKAVGIQQGGISKETITVHKNHLRSFIIALDLFAKELGV